MRNRTLLLALTSVAAAACATSSTTATASAGIGAMASAAPAPPRPALPAGVTTAMITLGDSLFNANACSRCHGRAGVGGANGPPLVKNDTATWLHSTGAYEEIVATIIAGVPREKLKDQTRRFQMNPRGSNPPLNDEQIRAVAAYIWKLNHP